MKTIMRVLIIAMAVMLTACLPGTPRHTAMMDADQLTNISDSDLCDALHTDHTNKTVLAEINSRKLINEDDRQMMWSHQIKRGMSECALRGSWGKPYKVHRRVSEYGASKQFVYASYIYNGSYSTLNIKAYVYLKNGVIESISQQS